MKINFIGDVHGKFLQLEKQLKAHEDNDLDHVILGDLGIGFSESRDQFYHHDIEMKYRTSFIHGNHDDPDKCKSFVSYIPNGHRQVTSDGTRILYLGGASSIDRHYRKSGVDWWYNEQMSKDTMSNLFSKSIDFKPHVIVSHTFPSKACEQLFNVGSPNKHWISDAVWGDEKTMKGMGCVPGIIPRTELYFQEIYEKHKPEVWIGGHWHMSRDLIIHDTRFICLNELEELTIDMSEIYENSKENSRDR